jgi:hypothetical protein
MFKVLILAYYYPPMGLSGVQRTLKFTKYMPHFNWEPTVITAGDVAYYAHDLSLLKEVEDANIRVIRTSARDVNSLLKGKYKTEGMPKEFTRKFLSNLSKTFFIPDNKLSWANKAYKTAKELLEKEKFDIIFTSGPPFSQFLTAAKLKKEFGIPLFVDYREMWLGNQFAFYPTPYHRLKHKKLEYSVLKEAEKIVVLNRKSKEKILVTYPFLQYEDVMIIPHGYDSADFENIEPAPKQNKKMRLTFSGIFYDKFTPEYLFRAFKELTVEQPQIADDIELEFIGFLRDENKKIVTELGLEKFVIELGYLNHEDVARHLKSTDALWMMIGNLNNVEAVSVGKLYEYFGSRKPILGCLPDGADKLALQEYKASFITYPDYIDDIKEALIEIYKLYKENKFPKPNEDFVLRHDRKYLTEQLTTAFQFFLRTE